MNNEIGSRWQPSASIEMLKRRAELLAQIRRFFHERDVLEVETPILSHFGNPDPNIESYKADGMFLHTSPEFPMKRLLAAGSGSIYQICKVFRKEEAGSKHNPEFSMLEWYRPGFSYHDLMDEMSELLRLAGFFQASKKLTYREMFQKYLGIDVFAATVVDLQQYAQSRGVVLNNSDGMDVDAWRDLLLSHFIEPELGRNGPEFIYDYPASQAALAQIRQGNPPVAERFELYVDGVEIANGYQELLDPGLQLQRWEAENGKRASRGQRTIPCDERMILALRSGIESCSGVALGLDRLLMVLVAETHIRSVLSFSNEIS